MNRFGISDNKRVDINDAVKGKKYYCDLCGGELIPKQGKVNVWHYAHKSGMDCDGSEMTQWHKDWQNLFPENCREVVLKDEEYGRHRADIKYGNVVIELQKRYLQSEEFLERSWFYHLFGHIFWIIDVRDKDIEICINRRTGKVQYHWSHAPKFGNCDWYKERELHEFRLHLILQLSDYDLVEVSWNKGGFKYFGGYSMNFNQLMKRIEKFA